MKKERKHIRLREFDYSSAGEYYITICTKNRIHFFGEIVDDIMRLSAIGEIVNQYWLEIPQHHPHIVLDEFIVMPNHLHGILILDYSVGTRHGVSPSIVSPSIVSPSIIPPSDVPPSLDEPSNRPSHGSSNRPRHGVALQGSQQNNDYSINQFSKPVAGSVSVIVNQFKSAVKKWCNKNGNQDFEWQPRFYDHVIRDSKSFENIRSYIHSNILNWKDDELNF